MKKYLLLLFFALVFSANALMAQCGVITFSADDSAGCAPLVSTFRVYNYPAGSEFAWDFGSGYGSQSLADSVKVKVFNIVGTYTVKVKIIFPGGATCIITKNNYIVVPNKPIALFSVDKPIICNGSDTVTFTDLTPKSKTRSWIIDGVVFSNGPMTIKYFFNKTGFKTVSLSIVDSLGCSANTNVDSAVSVFTAPNINFSASNTTGCTPVNVTFVPTITGLGGQVITNYSWVLTGSTIPISAATSPTVAYNTQGSYGANLTITTDKGCTYSLNKNNLVNVGSTIAITFSANNTNTCRNQIVRLINTTPGRPLPGTFTWVLPAAATITGGSVTADTVYISFATIGTYDIELKYLYNGCLTDKVIAAYINVRSPQADFTSLDRIHCSFPDSVLMNNTSVLPVTGVNSYAWVVYDLDKVTPLLTSTVKNPTFILNKYGKFDVRLIVSNTNGCSDTSRQANFIVIDTAAANFSATPSVACPGQNITLADLTPVFSNKASVRYKWIFYALNGTSTLNFSAGGNDTIASPIVKYDTAGTYNVKLIVSNKYGCGDTLLKTNFITIATPKAAFTASDSFVCAGANIVFTQQTTPPSAAYSSSWTIQHQDSANFTLTGTGSPITKKFLVPGKYDVKYKVSNGGSCADSITKTGFISVSGIRSDINSSAVSGCKSATINFASSLVYSFHYTDTANAVTYAWTCTPSGNGATGAGYSISAPTTYSTGINFTQNGTYIVSCLVTNSSGCQYIDSINGPIKINIGATSAFSINPVYCMYDTANIVNNSLLNPVAYKWYSDGAATFLPYDTSTTPKLIFNQRGLHPISLIAYSADGCADTSTTIIKISKPTANFVSADTSNPCGPVQVTFHSQSSSDVVSSTWDFGDGSAQLKTSDSIVTHIYSIKNGISDFSVTLFVENADGCSDFITKTNYIHITSAVPYFKISNNKGCEPLLVHIVDSSRNVMKFYFNYGYGQPDSTFIGDRVYTLASPSALYTVYKPFLIVTDKNGTGCFQTYQPADSIVVYSRPKAYFKAANSNGCTPFTASFVDTSIAATNWKWDFENDGIVDDTTQNPVHIYTTAGIYSVKLIVTNQFGCTDTLVKTNYINSFVKPVAKFLASDTVVCPHTAVTFTNQSTSSSPFIRYHWDFGVPGNADTSDYANPAPFIYDITGTYTVTLAEIDANGCMDTLKFINRITVLDSLPPSQPQIYYVTVVNDKDIQIIWNKNTAPDFKSYNLYRSGGAAFGMVAQNTLINDTSYTDNTGINVKSQPYNYNMDASDNCNYKTPLSLTHRTIFLDATTQSQNSNLITWTSYQGWAPGSFVYKLYRSHTYAGGYTLYTQLTDFDTSFVDLNLCDSDYYYFVDAFQPTTGFVSRSNIDFNHPPFYIPKTPVELIRATVINDKDILIEWDSSGIINTNRKLYLIDKMDPSGSFQNIASVVGNSYVDKKVDVHSQSYTYQVRMEDYCGNVMPASNIGRSILLNVSSMDYTVHLNWNYYGDWANDVQTYIIDLFDNASQSFKVMATVPNNVNSYDDNVLHNKDTAYCYRIRAVEAIQAIPDTSVSNIECIQLPPKLNIPNAFSPNKDNINDVFMPQGIFIQNLTGKVALDYLLRIYDRWGTLLFESKDINIGWDGTFMGKPCDEGVYVYEIRATGVDRHRFNYKGTLQLLR